MSFDKNVRVRKKARGLMVALNEVASQMQGKKLSRAQAEQELSSWFCTLWNRAEANVLSKFSGEKRHEPQ
jgi:hypothetical protein